MIRRLTLADASDLARLLAENSRFLAPFEPDWPDGFASVGYQRDRIRASEHLYGIVNESGLVGTVALSNVNRGVFESAHVGYWVEERSNGRGIATRAVAALAELAFGELGLHRLEAATLVDNAASQRVLAKNRFTLIGRAPRYLRIAGAWRDHLLFQKTLED